MKKILLFAILACLFVSCSSDGSCEIQIDEISFVPDHENDKTEDRQKVSSIFEVVPGKYELAWTKVQDMPQTQIYNVSLKLKLRLKKTVKFSQKALDDIGNEDSWFYGIELGLLDADGKQDRAVQGFYFGYKGATSDGSQFDKDEFMDFVNFLQSKPGTEKEFELNSYGMISSTGDDCIETCKNAKSVVCKVITDEDFERKYGTIVE